MAVFSIPVTRISYASRTLEIEAESEEQAYEIANETCGDHEFSEHTADYEFPEKPVKEALQ